ncbi:hypothetical protein ACRAWD_14445 [Caulobacter segnis]
MAPEVADRRTERGAAGRGSGSLRRRRSRPRALPAARRGGTTHALIAP